MTAHQLRSRNWFGRNDLDGFVHRSWLKAEGFSDAVFDGRSVVGIANSWSELTNCNAHLRQVAVGRARRSVAPPRGISGIAELLRRGGVGRRGDRESRYPVGRTVSLTCNCYATVSLAS